MSQFLQVALLLAVVASYSYHSRISRVRRSKYQCQHTSGREEVRLRRRLGSARRRAASSRHVYRDRAALERLVSDISATLVSAPTEFERMDSGESGVENALERLLDLIDLDYVAFWEFAEPRGRLVPLGIRQIGGASEMPRIPDVRHLRWAMQRLQRGELILDSTADLPKSAVEVRKYLTEYGLNSWLALPLRDRGTIFGALVFASTRTRVHWTSPVIARLQTIADLFASACKRSAAERALREKESFETSVLDSLPVNVALLDARGVVLHVNPRWSDFAARKGVPFHSRLGVGDSYLEACQEAVMNRESQAEELRDGVLSVLTGETEVFGMQYTCWPARRRRWFQLNVTPIPKPPGGAVVTHTDITAQKEAERAALELPGRLLRAQEEERSYIARELHDHVNQRLALMTINLEQLGHRMTDQSEEQSRIAKLRKEAVQISTDVHRLSHRLHPSRLEQLGLSSSIREQCGEFGEEHQLRVECRIHDVPTAVDNDVAACLFRILEEALHNAAKHGEAKKIVVELYAHRDRLCLRVSDNGKGFDPGGRAGTGGLGLISMRERLRLVRGELSIFSSPSHGATIEARVPLSRKHEQEQQVA